VAPHTQARPEAIAFLEAHVPRSLHLLGLIRENEARLVESCPGGVLVKPRTFYSLFAVTPDAAESLLDAVSWDGPVGFSAVPAELADIVAARGTVAWRGRFWFYYLPEAVHTAPPPQTVQPLRPEDAKIVHEYWPYGEPGNLQYVLERIDRGITAGLRLDGTLVAWGLTHSSGAMGFLHVLDEHRRRGYAQAVTAHLVAEIRRRGRTPFVYIDVSNTASVGLAERFGMVQVEQAEWMMLNES
jgi:ribosomal protein S18 acetylase RimI-like enzyme